MAILRARVEILEEKARNGGDEPHQEPLDSNEAAVYYRDFFRLLRSSAGMGGGMELDLLAVWQWADGRGIDRDQASEVLFGLLSEYREIMEELYPPPKK
jgi:hypothetical protein